MSEPARVELLHLTNSILEALATDPVIQAQFGGCFAGFSRKRPCPRCNGGVRRGESDYAAVRDCIGGLPPEKMVRLKQLLNAHKVRLEVRRGRSRVQLTF